MTPWVLDERYLTMKLLYYDDVTPADYQPPFFREAPYGTLPARFPFRSSGSAHWCAVRLHMHD